MEQYEPVSRYLARRARATKAALRVAALAAALAGPRPAWATLESFCAIPPDSTAARLAEFRADAAGLRLAFAERLAGFSSPAKVPECLVAFATADVGVNTDVVRESLLVWDLRVVPRMSPAQRAQWIRGVRLEHQAVTSGAPSDTQAELFAAAAPLFASSGHVRREAIVRGSLGRCLFLLGRMDEALDAYSKALEARERLGDLRLIELSLRSLGTTQLQRDHLREAVDFYQRAIAVGEQRGDRKSVIVTVEYLGQTYRRMHRFDDALVCYERAQGAVDLFPAADPTLNLIAIGLAQACRELGDVARARHVLEAEMGRLRDLGEPENLRVARTRTLFGDVLRRSGQLGPALDELVVAVAALDSLAAAFDLARAENCLASVYSELGHHGQALLHAQAARVHARESNNTDDWGSAETNSGMAFAALGQLDSATACFERALAVVGEETAPERAADVLQHWADALSANLDGAAAERILQRAIVINERLADRPRLAGNFIALGHALAVQGRLGEGRQALAHARELLAHDVDLPYLRFAVDLGTADNLELAGDLDSALVYCRRAVGSLEAGRSGLPASEAHRISFLRSKTYAYDALLQLLAKLDVKRPGAGFAEQGLDVTELARARALLERIQAAGIGSQPTTSHDAWAKPIGVAALRRRLLDESRSVLLEYACTDSVALLWVVTPKRTVLHRLAAPIVIGEEVRRLRHALLRQDASFVEPAARLYELLLAPARRELRDARTVHLVPDADLFLVPFEALVESDPITRADRSAGSDSQRTAIARGVRVAPGVESPRADAMPRGIRFALADAIVQYAPSATVLAALDSLVRTTRRTNEPALAAVGDPATGGRFAPLPFAAAEVEQIGTLFPAERRVVWMDRAAREDSIRHARSLFSSRFLHFATHGVVDSLVPERSHLVLAADSTAAARRDPANDGMLGVGEIERLSLAADLAVLSACETGLGRVVRGEGVMGLARAFLAAGARSVVVSLWSVEDRSTAAMMDGFYRGFMADGESVGQALRDARKKLRDSPDFAHPFFWSPFVLVGPGRRVFGPSP